MYNVFIIYLLEYCVSSISLYTHILSHLLFLTVKISCRMWFCNLVLNFLIKCTDFCFEFSNTQIIITKNPEIRKTTEICDIKIKIWCLLSWKKNILKFCSNIFWTVISKHIFFFIKCLLYTRLYRFRAAQYNSNNIDSYITIF